MNKLMMLTLTCVIIKKCDPSIEASVNEKGLGRIIPHDEYQKKFIAFHYFIEVGLFFSYSSSFLFQHPVFVCKSTFLPHT